MGIEKLVILAACRLFRTSIIGLFSIGLVFSCTNPPSQVKENSVWEDSTEKALVAATIDSFHRAAENAEYEAYFNFFAPEGTFIGTDATEHWTKEQFKAWAKPYFEKKKTWNFLPIQRHVYLNEQARMAWFDELLDTKMKICRGSGVLRKENNAWKVCQYVLSMTVPNENVKDVLAIKSHMEDSVMQAIKQK